MVTDKNGRERMCKNTMSLVLQVGKSVLPLAKVTVMREHVVEGRITYEHARLWQDAVRCPWHSVNYHPLWNTAQDKIINCCSLSQPTPSDGWVGPGSGRYPVAWTSHNSTFTRMIQMIYVLFFLIPQKQEVELFQRPVGTRLKMMMSSYLHQAVSQSAVRFHGLMDE